MSTSESTAQVKTSLRIWAGIRIGYGVTAILAPDLMFKVLRMKPHPDARGFNAFLGSRDIVVGLFALKAKTPDQLRDAVLMNQANETIDSLVLAQELRAGRGADLFSVVGVGFNCLGWLTWARARRLLR